MRSVSAPFPGCVAALFTAALVFCGIVAATDARAGDIAGLPAAAARARLDVLGWETTSEHFLKALATGHRPLIDLYLDAGTAVDVRDEKGRSPLLLALLGKDWSLADRLLATGADIARADENGTTPAMAAALGGNVELLRTLIERGVKLDVADARGHPPLHYAVAGRERAAVELLMGAGPAPSTPCCDGCGLLGHALQTGDWLVIDPILARIEGPLEWNEWSCAALRDAVAAADRARVLRLVEKHAGAPPAGAGAQPLLAYAVARNDLTQLRLMLECGFDPNTALTQEADPAMRELVASSFVRYYVDKEPGFNVLMMAAAMKRVECVRLLLEKGANKNAGTQGKSRLIALYFAAWADSAEGVQILLGKVPSRDALRIEISLDDQKAAVIKDGLHIYTAPISSGRKGFPTPTGDFVITDKHREHQSSLYHEAKMPYFMRLSCRDFGMHEGELPGRPASHGCIRLPGSAARKLFSEIPIGTWVSIRR